MVLNFLRESEGEEYSTINGQLRKKELSILEEYFDISGNTLALKKAITIEDIQDPAKMAVINVMITNSQK